MPALPRDWYFPASRARLYRRVLAAAMGAVVAAGIIVVASPLVVQYRDCRAAQAAGAAPLHRGEPGYAPHLDADGDGIACEPLPRR